MDGERHHDAGDEAERDQHGGKAERAAVDAFEPFEAGQSQVVGGGADVLERVALQQVHQAGEKTDADGDGAEQQHEPWNIAQT